jgi:hypothetical protein
MQPKHLHLYALGLSEQRYNHIRIGGVVRVYGDGDFPQFSEASLFGLGWYHLHTPQISVKTWQEDLQRYALDICERHYNCVRIGGAVRVCGGGDFRQF